MSTTDRNIVRNKRSLEPMEHSLGADTQTIVPPTGDLPETSTLIERATSGTFAPTEREKLLTIRFMEEPVEIMLHESIDPNAEQFIFCAVNGEGAGPQKLPWLPRGVPITVKRKHVERLARAKPISLSTFDTRDATGALAKGIRSRRALAYPFSVIHDPNPKGHDWLKGVLAEA